MSIKANTQIDVIDLELSRNEIRELKKTVNSIIISNFLKYFRMCKTSEHSNKKLR